MKHAFIVFVFTLSITLFYNYVGHLVPQKEVHPPKSAEIRADMSTAEMVEAGKIIVEGKGTCLTCHNGSARFPDFMKPTPIGARAGTTKSGMSDLEYLAESLCDPNGFIVPPFSPGMPAVTKPPIGLSLDEARVVVAYLQSLGGTPSVTMKTELKGCGADSAASSAPAASGGGKELTGQELFAQGGCMGCHSVSTPDRLVGPSLFDAGKRLTKAQLYEAILDPDATLAPGFPPALMTATLKGGGFYDKATSTDIQKIVEYLSTLKGGA